MPLATVNRIRSAILVVCITLLAVLGSCDNSRPHVAVSATSRDAFANPGSRGLGPVVPPAWYRGRAPIIRHQVDEMRNRAWILAWDGVHAYDLGKREKVGIVVLPGWSWVGEPYGCTPALAIGPQGEAIITSNVYPVVWRVDHKTLVVTANTLALDADADKDIGFSGLVYLPEQGAFIATSSFLDSMWRIDPLLKTAQRIALSLPLPRGCGWNISSPAPDRGKEQSLSLCITRQRLARQVRLAPDLRSADVVAQACDRRD